MDMFNNCYVVIIYFLANSATNRWGNKIRKSRFFNWLVGK